MVREASTAALKEYMMNRTNTQDLPPAPGTLAPPPIDVGVGMVSVQLKHIEIAFQKVKPSVSERVRNSFFTIIQ